MIGSETETALRALIKKRLQALDVEDETAEGNRATVTLDQQSVGRLSRMDALQQQAMAKATHQRRQTERAQLTAALKRLADGEYGECVDCGEDIEDARIFAAPAILRCKSCATG